MFKFFVFLIIHIILLEVLGVNGELEKYPIDGRIVGGHDADIKDYPYMLMVLRNGQPTCGAALFAERWAITAAQCVFNLPPSDITIRANSSVREGGEILAVTRILVHPDFDWRSRDSDIAVLELSTPATCKHCKIISLGTTLPKADDSVTITGWGLSDNAVYHRYLQAAQVPVVDHQTCLLAYRNLNGQVSENMFCAGTGGIDGCYGDAGVPAVINGAIVGIVSWRYVCAAPGYPGVYTLVPNFVEWIRFITQIAI